MGKSTKKYSTSKPTNKSKKPSSSKSHIKIITEELSENPHCENHGPALKFHETFDDGRSPNTFYGCSANRDRNCCRIRTALSAEDDLAQRTAAAEAYDTRMIEHVQRFATISDLPANERAYCGQCVRFVLPTERLHHSEHSPLLSRIDDEQLQKPTLLLSPLDRDKTEAQYFFDTSTLDAIQRMLVAANIRRVICIGAPRLHEHIRAQRADLHIDSVLLDLDERLEPFYGRDEFFRFNMLNGWFGDGGDRRSIEFDDWLRKDKSSLPLLFADPPFGCQTEPLAQTLKALQHRFARVHNAPKPAAPLPIMWIFPYYMGGYVQRSMPELHVNEFAVDYTNHGTYHNGPGGRKCGSPVRIFTNVPWSLWSRIASECGHYVACAKCNGRWRSSTTEHCQRCGECASQSGAAYRHCEMCAACVKPSYVHCERCARCVQRADHNCESYATVVTCWICKRAGHLERSCSEWQRTELGAQVWRKWCSVERRAKQMRSRMCLICGRIGHNERRCGERERRLGEWSFAGNIYNIFTGDE